MSVPEISVHLFRDDLRLADNPALCRSADAQYLVPVFILENTAFDGHLRQKQPIYQKDSYGAAGAVWLHHALESLDSQLDGKLNCFRGNSGDILLNICQQTGARQITLSKSHVPAQRAFDDTLAEFLSAHEITLLQIDTSLLWSFDEVKKADGTPYRVFTPFYRRGCLGAPPPRSPLAIPAFTLHDRLNGATRADAFGLLADMPWADDICQHWDISEQGAHNQLERFITSARDGLADYAEGRNFPAQKSTSRLSPYLRFGQISAHTAWHSASEAKPASDRNLDIFKSELGWREFSFSLLRQFPKLKDTPLQAKFERFEWEHNPEHLAAWQAGQTGYPIVDAGMRELYQTGYMHNRLRMIVGSFLVKNLLIDWRHGEAWFWDCLFDADPANNLAGWQWIAGCGADAAPYFRVFNPVTQGQKFDKHGEYTRKFVPELAKLPDKYLFNPFDAPDDVLRSAGVRLGVDYPYPLVDVKASRQRALDRFKQISEIV